MVQISEPGVGAQRPRPALASIVVPVYNESGNLAVLAEAVARALPDQPYELIFVDDGSRDATFEEIDRLAAGNPSICGVRLSRNFGHQYALSAGLRQARGQVVIMMDGDMQHPPSVLPELIAQWRQGYNIVQAQRHDTRQTSWFKRTTSRMFYRLFGALCGIPMDPGMADFRLVDRMVLDELLAMQEGQLFLRGLIAWMGYRRAVVPFEVGQRYSGRSKYTLRKMLRFAKSGIFAFSAVPLRIAIVVGLLTALFSFAELMFVVYVHFFSDAKTQAGWASTVAIMSLLFGVLFLLIGLQGEYILRIYERVQRRPPFLIERIVRQNAPVDDSKTKN